MIIIYILIMNIQPTIYNIRTDLAVHVYFIMNLKKMMDQVYNDYLYILFMIYKSLTYQLYVPKEIGSGVKENH